MVSAVVVPPGLPVVPRRIVTAAACVKFPTIPIMVFAIELPRLARIRKSTEPPAPSTTIGLDTGNAPTLPTGNADTSEPVATFAVNVVVV